MNEIEKKAEEYLKKNKICNNENWEVGGTYCYALAKQAYLDGMTEGRKEANEKNFKKAYQKYVNNSLATFDMKKALTDARDQIRIAKENEQLKAQIEKMKSATEELIKIQSLSIEDNYNAGLFNGFVTVFNSIFEEKYQCCKWNENKNKWELEQ